MHQTRPLSIEPPNTLVVGVPAGYNSVFEICDRPESRAAIETAIADRLGLDVRLTIRFEISQELAAKGGDPTRELFANDPFARRRYRIIRRPTDQNSSGRHRLNGFFFSFSKTKGRAVFNNLTDLLRNVGKIHETVERTRERLSKLRVEGSAGGGAVVVVLSGRMELESIRIDPKLLSDGDVELLEDVVASAVNQGLSKLKEEIAQNVSEGIPLSGLANFFDDAGKSKGV